MKTGCILFVGQIHSNTAFVDQPVLHMFHYYHGGIVTTTSIYVYCVPVCVCVYVCVCVCARMHMQIHV